MWNHISLVLLCVLLNSCASTKKEFDSSLQAGRCEDALKHLPENSTSAKILKQTTLGATTALSYSLTGASYTVEVAWDLIGGTIMFVGLCGPTIAIATAAGISHGPNAESGGTALPLPCFPGKLDALSSPAIGRKTFEATHDLRCPDLSAITTSVRKVASCQRSRLNEAAYKDAIQTLYSLRKSGQFYACVSAADRRAIDEEIEALLKIAH